MGSSKDAPSVVLGTSLDTTKRRSIEEEHIQQQSRTAHQCTGEDAQADRKPHAHLSLIVESAGLAWWDQDFTTGKIERSRNWALMLGYTQEEIAGGLSGWMDLIHPQDLDEVLEVVKSHEDGATPLFEVEHRLLTKGGRWKWILNWGKIVERDPDGRPIRAVGTHMDITHRKEIALEKGRMAEALRESEERYRKLFEICPDMIAVTVGGRIEYANPACAKVLGETAPSQFVGKEIDLFIHPDDRAQVREQMQKQLETGLPAPAMEIRFLRLDGTTISGDAIAIPFTYKGVPAVQVIARDMTDRKRAEAERQKLAAVVHHSRELVNLATLDGNMTFLNEAGRRMLGIGPQEVESVNIMQVIPEHLVELVESELLPTLMRGGIWEGDLQYRNLQTGCLTDVHAITFTVKKPESCEPWFLANVSLDITARKKAELDRLNLEKKILQAQKLESLGVLAGGIAHDFNNLLMGVLGNAEMALLDMNPESPIRSRIQDIQTAGVRLAELTKQMLAYSGKGKFVVERLSLSRMVEEMVHLLKISIPKRVALAYELDSNLPAILGDASQIRQVVMNLITNAAEACGKKDGIVSVCTGVLYADRSTLLEYDLSEELPEGDYVFLEVSDNGCGMDKETKKKIFDPFFSTKFTGRGLGMAAVLGIIRSHCGAVQICSEPNKGTSAKVLLPKEEVECDEFQAITTDDSHMFRGQGMVLLVDDEEAVLTTVRHMLERMGYTVLSAVDGIEAVNQVREHAAELVCVLLDLTMPRMDGREAFAKIHQIRQNLPVILCSGYNQQEARRQFVGEGLTDFLQKPFRYKSLVDKLREVLE